MAELSLIVKATCVVLLALGGVRLARGTRASVRALLLSSAFGILLVLPLATWPAPARTIEIPAVYVPATYVEPFQSGEQILAESGPVALPARSGWTLPSPVTVARVVWAAGAVVFLIPIATALAGLRRLRRSGASWRPVGSVAAVFNADLTYAPELDHGGVPEPSAGPSVYTALREQLGLSLEAQRGPVEVIVIDRRERPADN